MTAAATALAGRTLQNETDIEVLTSLLLGAGSIGSDAMATYATRFDQIDPTLAYLGDAQPGVATSAASWRMRKLDFGVDGDVTVTWADGDANFDNVWDDRASLTYS